MNEQKTKLEHAMMSFALMGGLLVSPRLRPGRPVFAHNDTHEDIVSPAANRRLQVGRIFRRRV